MYLFNFVTYTSCAAELRLDVPLGEEITPDLYSKMQISLLKPIQQLQIQLQNSKDHVDSLRSKISTLEKDKDVIYEQHDEKEIMLTKELSKTRHDIEVLHEKNSVLVRDKEELQQTIHDLKTQLRIAEKNRGQNELEMNRETNSIVERYRVIIGSLIRRTNNQIKSIRETYEREREIREHHIVKLMDENHSLRNERTSVAVGVGASMYDTDIKISNIFIDRKAKIRNLRGWDHSRSGLIGLKLLEVGIISTTFYQLTL
jgi:cell division protein FtsB